jgi:hypothetical protein
MKDPDDFNGPCLKFTRWLYIVGRYHVAHQFAQQTFGKQIKITLFISQDVRNKLFTSHSIWVGLVVSPPCWPAQTFSTGRAPWQHEVWYPAGLHSGHVGVPRGCPLAWSNMEFCGFCLLFVYPKYWFLRHRSSRTNHFFVVPGFRFR